MDKTYQPGQIESQWYQTWEERGYFAPGGTGSPYCIMIPPPNVTGSLHMGHGFQESIMDALIRYQRMRGNNTLWQVGTDHAGIATQMVVERQLEEQGLSRHDLGRERFIDKVWDWKEHSGGTITRQLRRLGASIDWSRERFTMDDGFYRAVQEAFIRLHKEGLIYRGKRLVNWDPQLHTAISDLEVLSEEEQGHLWHFRYPLSDGSGEVVVATTRPETMLGDTAVAVHPEDERYSHLIGRSIALPLTGREIPIIADDYVDPEFGTGCVKITPAHDFNDYDMGQRHQLPMINILDRDARLNDQVPEAYRGMDRFDARRQVVADLKAQGLLDKVVDHTLKVPRGDRSGVVIEPWLTNQWYVRTGPLAEKAIEAVENDRIQFVPKQWENTYFAWMRDIQDWCISRQLWWGHRIPAWYDDQGKVYVGRSEADVRTEHGLGDEVALRQDDDVLDTWFSSSLWTFATLGWPERGELLNTFHPSNVLVTGFDIIFFWVARMIMMTLHFMDEVPFHTVYVHGLVRDNHGQKMSKSKGNVLDPIDLIDGIELDALVDKRTTGMMQPQLRERIAKVTREDFPDGLAAYGTDALRYTFYSLASTGRDINFDVGRIQGYRNFCNKIWNAARYVMMQCGDAPQTAAGEPGLADRWISAQLRQTTAAIDDAVAQFRFDLASQALYEFIWNEYCDWYLELSKPVLYDDNAPAAVKQGARHTLVTVLEHTLRLLHPFMPFITEEIWQRVAPLAGQSGPTIMLSAWPQFSADDGNRSADQQDRADIDWLKGVIVAVRNIRGEMNIAPGRELPLLLRNGSNEDQRRLQDNRALLQKLAKVGDIGWLEADQEAPAASTQMVGNLEVLVPMADLIDKEAEIARLGKELGKLDKDLERTRRKLENSGFLAKAPEQVVAKEREKLEGLEHNIAQLRAQLERIEQM